MLRRVILTTGGTGGHIFPALAVADAIRVANPEVRILFIGGEHGPEAAMAAKAGLEFAALPARGVLGRGVKSLAAPLWIARSLARATGLLRSFAPEAVAGFGGYASFSPVLAALLLRIPVLIQEQNSQPGLVNRIFGRFADRVAVSFPDERGFFPAGRTMLAGNPVRASIAALRGQAKSPADTGRNILILGGSQGARAVNEAMLGAAKALISAGASILHHAGHRDADRVREEYRKLGLTAVRVEPFIEDMAAAYAWADLVVCRAGATTVAEVAAAGKACLFIPFPHATHDHQSVNANFLARAGAAVVVEERDLHRTDLAATITGLLADPVRLAAMAGAASRLGRPDAARTVASELELLASSRR